MATTHHLKGVLRRPRRAAGRATIALTALLSLSLLGAPASSAAPSAAQSEHDRVAAEVQGIEQRVREAEERLQQMTLRAEEASGAVLAAQAELDRARQHADAIAAELAAVREAVGRTQDDVATLGREAYMGSDEAFTEIEMVLHAEGPGELLQQAATLDLLGEDRARVLEELRVAEAREARLDREAKAAVAERDAAAHKAEEAQTEADRLLGEAQAEFDALTAEKASLDQQLRDAEIRLLEVKGAEDAARAYDEAQAAEQALMTVAAAPGGSGAALTQGRVTSCYGARWGTMHLGVDIAAPIGTPIYTPEPGVVLQAGPASGFGLAVAIQHPDGVITVYGHVNQFFVSPGQVVSGGQQIAEVGNRGQSTGPHLHFETHRGGLYADRANPVSWLAQRGISLGGSCS
ncbi:peptidoglycan DD-metalloendopeptidase family protein [Blastococcus sp. BMG 814]|uniref:Peptidoglycan DD-metalloendopeptidase family protein n=1 Tax=Blastococcus carthaginiensis TaxID=3050034 RepID=A0ABT9IEZ8_9ACTN|nr:M23 family metallopeptidase [Blastococcus carthaginiensis]MDP5184160.1 peptidoglycan DD-metalloendopeptidase family protein [Blastococcus carthaginiensis]